MLAVFSIKGSRLCHLEPTGRTDLGDRGQTWRLLQHGDDFIHAGLHPGQVFMVDLGSRPVTSHSLDNLVEGGFVTY